MSPQKQYIFDLSQPPILGEENFFVSGSNRDAFSWVMHWPQWPTYGLVVYGPKGSGKTHLARLWQQKSKAIELDAALLGKASSPELMNGSSCCIIDNICQSIDQEGLFHLLNHIREIKGFILLTSEKSQSAWDITLPDLQSRLKALPSAAIAEPDDELLKSLILKLFSDRQLKPASEIIDYLLPRMERSFDATAELVDQIDRAALTDHRKLSLPLVREILDKFYIKSTKILGN